MNGSRSSVMKGQEKKESHLNIRAARTEINRKKGHYNTNSNNKLIEISLCFARPEGFGCCLVWLRLAGALYWGGCVYMKNVFVHNSYAVGLTLANQIESSSRHSHWWTRTELLPPIPDGPQCVYKLPWTIKTVFSCCYINFFFFLSFLFFFFSPGLFILDARSSVTS